MRTYRVAAGQIIQDQEYRISYRCTMPGPEVDTGTVKGVWTGEIDAFGKLTIQPTGGEDCLYLFAEEFEEIFALH